MGRVPDYAGRCFQGSVVFSREEYMGCLYRPLYFFLLSSHLRGCDMQINFLRVCQECGHRQEDRDPRGMTEQQYNIYSERKCKKCKSSALDYGREYPNIDPRELNKLDDNIINPT